MSQCNIKILIDEVNTLTEKLKMLVSLIKQNRIRLYKQGWLESHNGIPGTPRYVYGVVIDNPVVLDAVAEILRIVHYDENIVVDFIAITNNDIIVQWHSDIYNDHGSYVGTEHRYESLPLLLKKLLKELKKDWENGA